MLTKKEKIYEGKAKILYTTNDSTTLIQYFKDDATAFNAKKKGTIVNKGVLNNQMSSFIFQFLEKKVSEGKSKKHALTCLKRQIIDIIWSMLKEKRAYYP